MFGWFSVGFWRTCSCQCDISTFMSIKALSSSSTAGICFCVFSVSLLHSNIFLFQIYLVTLLLWQVFILNPPLCLSPPEGLLPLRLLSRTCGHYWRPCPGHKDVDVVPMSSTCSRDASQLFVVQQHSRTESGRIDPEQQLSDALHTGLNGAGLFICKGIFLDSGIYSIKGPSASFTLTITHVCVWAKSIDVSV